MPVVSAVGVIHAVRSPPDPLKVTLEDSTSALLDDSALKVRLAKGVSLSETVIDKESVSSTAVL